MLDVLEQFVRDSTDELPRSLPAEQRLEGLSLDGVLAAISALHPETQAALAQRLTENKPS